MQEVLETAGGESLAERLRLPDVFELARRFSGLIAIAVLTVTMIVMTLRAEFEPPAQPYPVTVAAPMQPTTSADTTTSRTSSPFSAASQYTEPPTTIYYLYATDEQYQLIRTAEYYQAAAEANGGFPIAPHTFVSLKASTPDEEQIARDTIYEAMLAGADGTEMFIVQDLRDISDDGTGAAAPSTEGP